MGLILQLVGRNPIEYNSVKYEIEGQTSEARLVAQALQRVYRGHKVVLLAPESLAIELGNNVEEISTFLRESRKMEEHLNELVKEKGLLEELFQALVIQSTGSYTRSMEGERYIISFENRLDNVMVYLFWKLLGFVRNGQVIDEIIADVSTGHNIYVAALLDSLRALIVYVKLSRLLQGKAALRVRLAVVPPVPRSMGYSGMALPVSFYDYDVKAFFEFPLKEEKTGSANFFVMEELSGEQKKEVGIALREERKHVNELLKAAKMAFNAIKYNVPLAMFYRELVNLEEPPERGLECLDKILGYFEDKRSIFIDCGRAVVKRWSLNKTRFLNTAYSLALMASLREFWEGLRDVKPTTAEIRRIFCDVYKKVGLGLNARFLDRDLKEIEEASQELQVGEERELSSLRAERKGGPTTTPPPKSSDIVRNFFAHSGFLHERVVVRKEDPKTLLLSYQKGSLDDIKGWLESPEHY